MKVLLIDQHPAIIQGLKSVLAQNSSIEVSCLNYLDNSRLFEEIFHVDVVVLGVPGNLPELFSSIRKIREINASVPLLVYGVDKNSSVIDRLVFEPVQGIFALQYELDNFYGALLKTPANIGSKPLQFGFKYAQYSDSSATCLSARELEIVHLIASEKTTSEIAQELSITISTVENHRKNIFRKMGVRNLAGMVLHAAKTGYIA